MIERLFARKPDPRDMLYAEAQALVDDGLERDFVLDLYPDDREWLAPLLQTAEQIEEAFETESPSYYFEGSLKAKFLAAARERFETPAPSPAQRARTAVASASVMLAAGAMGVLTLGFVTASSSVPGEWNYSFKLANERIQYTLSRGDERANIQVGHAEARVQEIRVISTRREVSAEDLAKLERDARDLQVLLTRSKEVDPALQAKVKSLTESARPLLENLRNQPQLETAVARTNKALNETASAAGLGEVTTIAATPTATPTPEPSPTATAEPTATPSPSPTPDDGEEDDGSEDDADLATPTPPGTPRASAD
jgi:hypothetical protein